MDFEIGDIVKLKSGSPKMTIEDIGKYNYSTEDKALCTWFDGSKKLQDTFVLESLTKFE